MINNRNFFKFTLVIAVNADSHAASRSWSNNWIQLEITLKTNGEN